MVLVYPLPSALARQIKQSKHVRSLKVPNNMNCYLNYVTSVHLSVQCLLLHFCSTYLFSDFLFYIPKTSTFECQVQKCSFTNSAKCSIWMSVLEACVDDISKCSGSIRSLAAGLEQMCKYPWAGTRGPANGSQPSIPVEQDVLLHPPIYWNLSSNILESIFLYWFKIFLYQYLPMCPSVFQS